MQASEALLVGGFTTPTSVRPYMKPRRLAVRVTGLRPNTNLFIFYNDVNVSTYCRPITVPTTGDLSTEASWTITGEIGSQITSTSAGDACFLFYVPAQTFLVGSGILVVKDATDASYTTRAEVTYNTFNFPQAPEDSYNTRLVQVEGTKKDRQIGGKNQLAGGFLNPLSWTINVNSNMARNREGIFVSALDLYFTAKDATFGCVVEIRDVENGIPKSNNLPLSRIRLTPADISITDKTEVTFPGIVFLASGKEYAISLIPDGGASNYAIRTGRVGEKDVTSNAFISKDWEGKLFLPTNGSDWQSLTDEYPKFKLYFAEFTSNSGYGTLVNRDYEFFTLANTSGNFMPGELVTQIPTSILAGQAVINSSSYEVYGLATTFTTNFNSNDYFIAVNSNTDIDIIRIESVSNNTFLTLKKKPSFSNSAAEMWKSPVGRVDSFNTYRNALTLIDSSASNAAFLFEENRLLVGADSGASANGVDLINKDVNLFQPLISTTTVTGTDLRLNGSVIGDDYSSVAQSPYNIGTNLIDERSAVVASKSNEILYFAGGKSFTMNVEFSSQSNTLSPVVDLAIPTVMVYGNRINSNNMSENTKSGSAFSRYVSKTVNLKDGLDSEDIKVVMTAYRPPGTELDVYVKLLNSSDPDTFDNKDWTRMVNSSNNGFSDAVNKNDFIEMEYILPTSPVDSLQVGSVSVNTASANCIGSGTTFTSTVAAGDIILISSGALSQVTKVLTVSNNTLLILDSNVSFTSSSGSYSTLSPQKSAFKDSTTDTVKYYSSDGVAYLTFKTFAIKIVFLSDHAYLSPKADNIRVVASV